MQALLSIEFKNFIRVGNMKKIDRNILPYSLHTDTSGQNEEGSNLKALEERKQKPGITKAEIRDVR